MSRISRMGKMKTKWWTKIRRNNRMTKGWRQRSRSLRKSKKLPNSRNKRRNSRISRNWNLRSLIIRQILRPKFQNPRDPRLYRIPVDRTYQFQASLRTRKWSPCSNFKKRKPKINKFPGKIFPTCIRWLSRTNYNKFSIPRCLQHSKVLTNLVSDCI